MLPLSLYSWDLLVLEEQRDDCKLGVTKAFVAGGATNAAKAANIIDAVILNMMMIILFVNYYV